MLKVFSVYDVKSQTYSQPFFQPTVEVAVRLFKDVVVNQKDSPYSKFPEDFQLFCLGDFDDVSGLFSSGDE